MPKLRTAMLALFTFALVSQVHATPSTAAVAPTARSTAPAPVAGQATQPAPIARAVTVDRAPATTFGDGTFEVGTDIKPGTYVANVPDDSFGCYWERDNSLDGSADSILANDNLPAGAHAAVTIKPSDKGFQSQDCGTWHAGDSVTASPATSFGDGSYRVGEDIKAGKYVTTVPDDSVGCYWVRARSLDGSLDAIIANENLDAGAHGVVVIKPTDRGFESLDCGTWRRAG